MGENTVYSNRQSRVQVLGTDSMTLSRLLILKLSFLVGKIGRLWG